MTAIFSPKTLVVGAAELVDGATQCTLHRGAFYQFPFRLIYYGSNKSIRKKNDKTHLCAVYEAVAQPKYKK